LTILVWCIQPPPDKPQASKATKLLQLELHKLATKRNNNKLNKIDTKVSARGNFGMLYRGAMIEPTKVNTKIVNEVTNHWDEIQLIKHN
jgi:hypothetical protein